MKMKRKNFAIGIVSFFMIGMVFGTFSINSAKAQGIVNGGFETGDFTGWDIWTSSTYPAEFSITNDSHSGYYAAKGSIDLSGECGSMEQRFNVSQNVALSFYYKANMQSGPNIDYGGYRLLSGWSLYDETQNTQITQGYFDKKENYTNVWFDLSAYHGHIMKLRVYIGSDGVNGIPIDYKAFIDDVDILVDNLPPVADAEPDHQVVYVEEEVWFSGNGSYDPDGHIVCYHWDFGDGTTGSGMIVSHIYYSIGNFNVTLTVTDNDGLTDEDTCTVSVRNQTPPPPPPPPSNDDWPMFNHDPEHTGFSTSTAPDNSSLLWTFTGSWPMTSPSVSHGLVFVACGWSSLTALNASTGETIWTYDFWGWPSQPVLANQRVFVSTLEFQNTSDEVHVYCLNEFLGDLIWEWNSSELNWPSSPPLFLEGPPLTIANNHIYLGLSAIPDPGGQGGSMIICLDETTGDLIWSVNLADLGLDYMHVPLTVANNMIFGCSANQLFALDESNGDLLWTFYNNRPAWFESAPAVLNGKLFIGCDNTHMFYCLNANSGSIIWQTSLGANYSFTAPALAYSKVFVGANEVITQNDTTEYVDPIFALDQDTGEVLWRYDISTAVVSSPAVADNKVFNSFYDGRICALDAATGSVIWTFPTRSSSWYLHQSLAIAYGNLYASMGYTLIAFGPGGTINIPPHAEAEPPIQTTYVGGEAWFSGHRSYDPDGHIVSYHWDFGDGTFGNGVYTTHNYTMPGIYNVTLTVTDDEGATDSDEVMVIVEEEGPPVNRPPVADAEPDHQVIYAGEEAWFTGNRSYDPDGYIVSYHWYFGDGTNGSGVTVTHIYNIPGNYTVMLTVTDDDGDSDSDFVTVTVLGEPPENFPPVAMAEPPIQMVYVGEEAWFSGNYSYDPDGYIVAYRWDFGDGTFGRGIWVTHIYNMTGIYEVTLTVVDNDGATDSYQVLVIVEEEGPPQNQPPVAMAEPPIQMINVGDEAWFSGNCSYDPDGYIVSYHWDFGDGTSGNGEWVTHIYNYPGNYTVT
ncbi:MAG: PKD domain-containing protein, partial [Thermoplasmata archaeon]